MKKLWLVTIEAEAVAYAETREEAERLVSKYDVDFTQDARELTSIPDEWDDVPPFGEDEKTVRELIDEGVNPGLKERLEMQRSALERARARCRR